MTKRRVCGNIDANRLVERCKGALLKHLVGSIVKPLEQLGYIEFPDKTPCMIGSHQIVTIDLPFECRCGKTCKFQWSVQRKILEKGCGSYTCPSSEYAVQEEGDVITLHHIADHECRRRVVKPAQQHVRTEVEDDPMMVAANEGGMKLAEMLKKLNDPMTDVFDGKHWWYFKCVGGDGRWYKDKSGLNIHLTVNRTIRDRFGAFKVSKGSKSVDDACDLLIRKINTRHYRDPLVKDCCATFYDPDFLNKLDSLPGLIGCKNGVFDIDKGEFRDGRPTDYLTFSTNIKYLDPTIYGDIHENPAYPLINKFLEDVLGKEFAQFIHTSVCQYLHADTSHSRFFMWVGGGSNGKSKLQSLYRMCLGDYAITMPSTVITGKQVENGRACPELARGEHVRIIFFSEPSTNETLASGTVKLMTGLDKMFVRGLYKDGHEIVIRGLPICCCNETPVINDQSDGMWRRLVECPFESHFVSNPDPAKPNEKLIDEGLDAKLHMWKEVLLTDMLNWAFQCKSNNVGPPKLPKLVQAATDRYRCENDYYSEFFKEMVTKSVVWTDTLQWTDVWTTFRSWMGRSYGWDNLPKKLKARQAFEDPKCFGEKLKNGQWVGWQMPTRQFSGV